MAIEDAFIQPTVPKVKWSLQSLGDAFGNFLRSRKYLGMVENGVSAAAVGVTSTEAQKKICEEQQLNDPKAKNYLFQALDHSILETIINKDTSKSIWDSIKQKYQGKTRVKVLIYKLCERSMKLLT